MPAPHLVVWCVSCLSKSECLVVASHLRNLNELQYQWVTRCTGLSAIWLKQRTPPVIEKSHPLIYRTKINRKWQDETISHQMLCPTRIKQALSIRRLYVPEFLQVLHRQQPQTWMKLIFQYFQPGRGLTAHLGKHVGWTLLKKRRDQQINRPFYYTSKRMASEEHYTGGLLDKYTVRHAWTGKLENIDQQTEFSPSTNMD